MHRSGNDVPFWSAVSMAIGAMVGAGIFALLGQGGAIAGSAVWISFLIGGTIALLSGYSMAHDIPRPAASLNISSKDSVLAGSRER